MCNIIFVVTSQIPHLLENTNYDAQNALDGRWTIFRDYIALDYYFWTPFRGIGLFKEDILTCLTAV